MKLSDVKKLVELPPRKRAEHCLAMGEEIQKLGKRPVPVGALPAALRRESVQATAAAPMMMRLHGITGTAPEKAKGLRATGRRLKTKAGTVDDFVLTPQARKKIATTSLKQRGKDKSLADSAVRQLAITMLDSNPVTRCCGAYAYWQATGAAAAIPVLENAIESSDPEERLLAAHCLAKMEAPQAKRLQGTAKDDRPQTPPQPIANSMTVIIHGTFAKDEPWYKPGGDFHKYIKQSVYPDVYSDQDFYFWSGRYALTDNGLKNIWRQAARKLVSWVQAHPANTLRLIAHSHGNNVVNMATQMGLRACSLIQLSPPVHGWNLPKMQNVASNRLFNIHSSIDLVVRVDGGAGLPRHGSGLDGENQNHFAFRPLGFARAEAVDEKESSGAGQDRVPVSMDRQEETKQGSSGGSKFGVIGVLVNYMLGRLAPGFAVKRLIHALGSPSEETSMAAYMALVKLGPRNADRLLAAAQQGRRTASIVQLLGDMGDRRVIPDLQEFAQSADPQVAAAARDSIEVLQSGSEAE